MNLNKFKSVFFALILLSSFITNVYAQGSGSISGKLVDAANGQPLAFASVSLISKSGTRPAKNMQTDIDGKFNLTGISDGIYLLRSTYVGYLSRTRDSIRVMPAKQNIQLGAIKMRVAKGVLKEVVVSAQRSQIKLDIDKKSFSVAESLVSQGGSATDLLTNVPSVQVDVDGNLSLRGSSNVKVLINGKPSTLTGSNLTDILQSIPASAIETIEVITNPSSKYDAEGESGIINIVMKKNAQIGFTGSASASVGTQNTVNGTLNLAYQTKKVNIYGNYSYRKSDRIGNGFIDKNTTDNFNNTEYTNQISNQKFAIGGQNIRSGIDFFLDPKNTLSFSDNINIRDRNLYQNGLTTVTRNGVPYELQNQNNFNVGTGTNLDFSLDFDHKFKKKQEELTASVGYSDDVNDNHAYLNTTTDSSGVVSPLLYNNYTKGQQHNINAQTDYTLPLKDGKFEAGYRGTFNKSDNNYMVYSLDTTNYSSFIFSPNLSNDFIYKQNINAVYGNYQHQFGNFGIQGGLRLEDTHVNTQLNTNNTITTNKQDYSRIYPTLFLSEKLSENQTLQLSYSRRVARPNDRQLSPFLDVSNTQNYTQGNPNLLPEDTHSMELSYINYWPSVTLTSSLYYRLTNDDIQQITSYLNSTTNLTTFDNIKSATNAGYELIAKVSPAPILDLTANLNAYYKHIEGDPALGFMASSGYSYNGNLTASIKASKKLGFQLRGDYQSEQVTAQGKNLSRYGMDGGIKYDVSKAISLSLNSRDIFNTRKYITETHLAQGNFTEDETSQRRFSTRTVLFTLSYHIGGPGTQNRRRNKEKDMKDKDKNNNQQQVDPDDPEDMQPSLNGTPGQGVTPGLNGGGGPSIGTGAGSGRAN
jgi:outer membrane receptor protein involved in Fe transport